MTSREDLFTLKKHFYVHLYFHKGLHNYTKCANKRFSQELTLDPPFSQCVKNSFGGVGLP